MGQENPTRSGSIDRPNEQIEDFNTEVESWYYDEDDARDSAVTLTIRYQTSERESHGKLKLSFTDLDDARDLGWGLMQAGDLIKNREQKSDPYIGPISMVADSD